MTEKEKKVIDMYESGVSMVDIGIHFGHKSDSMVRRVFKEHGIQARSTAGSKGLFLNHRYFKDINTENKAYFLGLLLTDGNVYESSRANRQPCVSIKLVDTDSEVLDILKEEINTSNEIMVKDENYRQLSVHSSEMAKDLARYSVTPRKTFTCSLPVLDNKHLMRHLIRGVIDGDGWISQKTSTKKYSIGLSGGSSVPYDVMKYLNIRLDLPILSIKKSDTSNQLEYQSQVDVRKLANYLYKDSSVFIKRKKSVIQHMLEK